MTNRQKQRLAIGAIALLVFAIRWFITKPAADSNAPLAQNAPANKGQARATPQPSQQGGAPSSLDHLPKWSASSPAINLHHVFFGEINRKGKPVGFHSRPGSNDPRGSRLVAIKDGPNRLGVYTATIEVQDDGQWKQKFSSFFPDAMSASDVQKAILHAYSNSSAPKRQPWTGPSGLGFDIQGYTLSRGDINTAFPIYRRD